MNEFVDIIVIYIVFRAILAFLAHGGMVTDATISDETDKGIGLDSIANHRGETAWQTEECRIPPFMHPSVSLICDALKDSFLHYIGFSEKYS